MQLPRLPERPSPYLPVVTYGLIGLCVLAFVVSPLSGLDPVFGSGAARSCAAQEWLRHWGVVPRELLNNRARAYLPPTGCAAPGPGALGKVPALSVFTALFVHGGWMHLAGNMLFLFVFGAAVEERMGSLAFLLFYVGAGYAATYGYAVANSSGPGATQTLVGASGAIAGVLGAYLWLFPRARVTCLVPVLLFVPLRFPAWLVLGFWFAVQWVSIHQAAASVPGVAYAAHLIGFASGFVFAWLLYGRRRARSDGSGGYAGVPTRTEPAPYQETLS